MGNQPIGIMDSGVGGLTVASEVMRQLPHETICYVGDAARCPYGPRHSEEVRHFTWQMAHFLMDQNSKLLIIACNTATAVALDDLRAKLPIPVIGVVHPGARAAINMSRTRRIGVIGTEGTVKSGAYTRALQSIHRGVQVSPLACPKFVPLVESNAYEGEIARQIVQETLQPLVTIELDTLILGCTHYPLLEPLIQRTMGDHVSIISSGEETARETSLVLYDRGIVANTDNHKGHTFYTTGSIELFETILDNWLPPHNRMIRPVSLDRY
ncbi:glutamate racemase [Bacillus fonticola]|uniref:glutamate racemase n=1 Tax=Bacillus fonticola TaxID=2728853 RepID=UPI001475E673|nr:glutamate racemase [Bacillus fonticola]